MIRLLSLLKEYFNYMCFIESVFQLHLLYKYKMQTHPHFSSKQLDMLSTDQLTYMIAMQPVVWRNPQVCLLLVQSW